jgi:hypothetical protein
VDRYLGRSLDEWSRCREPSGGCRWYVLAPATVCSEHGGDEATPEFWESEDGEILLTHHMDTLEATNGD